MRDLAGLSIKSLAMLILSVSLLAACGGSPLPLQPEPTSTDKVVEDGVTPVLEAATPSNTPATVELTLDATGTPLPRATSTPLVPVVPAGEVTTDPALTLVARDIDIRP